MGYTTDFEGHFNIEPPLAPEHFDYLTHFKRTRRMRRDALRAAKSEDPLREAVGLPVGIQGGYFVGEGGFKGQNRSSDILDYNAPPKGQPGLWCQWEPSEDGSALVWDGGEKFYSYVEWLDYLITHFLEPWGYKVEGVVTWQGEGHGDVGVIRVICNKIETQSGIQGLVAEG